MADETVVIEAPEASGEIETTETPEIGVETTTENQIDEGNEPTEGETGHLRGSELYRSVKDKLKSSGMSSQEIRSIRNAIHIAAKADQATGGDLGKFEAMQETYSGLALEGEEGLSPEQIVEARVEDSRQLAGILQDIASGAPKLIDELIEDHPQSFARLAPVAIDRWAQTNNEAFSSYVANATLNYLKSAEVPLQFKLLDRFLPQQSTDPSTQAVIDAFNSVKEAFAGLEQMASKPVRSEEKPNTPQTQGGDREQQISQREQNITRQEWNQTAGRSSMQIYSSEVSRLASSRKVTLTDSEKKSVMAAVREEFDSRLAANRRYGQDMQAFLQNGNRKGYEDRAAAEGKKMLPSIIARHFDAEVAKRQSTAKQNGNGKPVAKPVTPSKDGNGNLIQHLSGHPRTLGKRVDLNRTTHSMLQRNQAYLVGEKSVFQWPAKKV